MIEQLEAANARIEAYERREREVCSTLCSALGGSRVSDDIVHLALMAKLQIITDGDVIRRFGDVAQQLLDVNVRRDGK